MSVKVREPLAESGMRLFGVPVLPDSVCRYRFSGTGETFPCMVAFLD